MSLKINNKIKMFKKKEFRLKVLKTFEKDKEGKKTKKLQLNPLMQGIEQTIDIEWTPFDLLVEKEKRLKIVEDSKIEIAAKEREIEVQFLSINHIDKIMNTPEIKKLVKDAEKIEKEKEKENKAKACKEAIIKSAKTIKDSESKEEEAFAFRILKPFEFPKGIARKKGDTIFLTNRELEGFAHDLIEVIE